MNAPTTLTHYRRCAADYTVALLNHDTEGCRTPFLAALPTSGPTDVLDLGCGPGRDLAAFAAAGHRAIGMDGTAELAAHARTLSGCPVIEADLLTYAPPPATFDGIFANAVLFHVPTLVLPALLGRLAAGLRPGGVFFTCDPTGANEEGWAEDRYVAFRHPATVKRLCRAAGFTLISDWRRPPDAPRRSQNWLATLWRVGHAPEAV